MGSGALAAHYRDASVSGLVAVAYVVAAYVASGAESAFKIALCTILPLACIWFADAMGGYVGPTTMIAITNRSPGWAVCILGWVLLLLPLIIVIIDALAG